MSSNCVVFSLWLQRSWGWDQATVREESSPGWGVRESFVSIQRPGGEKPDKNVWWYETTDD